ncbi:MAG: ABC transporter permease [Thermoplasmatales archaeon]|jgi:peptide/nickel transport system permease protein|nr:ABC transporter permease [Candidatus Thermoplasmatota archaeon]MCL6003461.1 ABC transporter permease [Candidatus Thermoplasmatota archaeon]MDA8055756.1 ABC transporter permease [Thermoplasmatales archaeon]
MSNTGSPGRRAQRLAYFSRLKKNLSFQVGVVIIGIYLVISLLDIIYPRYIGVTNAFNLFSFTNPGLKSVALAQPSPPTLNRGWLYVFGTTAYEIPILPVALASIPVDLGYAVAVAGASAIVGTFIGVNGTFYSKKLEWVISSLSNAFISFPLIISVMIFGLLMHFSLIAIFVGIILVLWAYYAQIARMLTLNLQGKQFIESARAAGDSNSRIVFKHIIPNMVTPILVRFSLDMATVILIFSAANFMFWQQFIPLATTPELGGLMNGFPEFGFEFGYPLGGIVLGQQAHLIPSTASLFLYQGFWWTVLFPVIFLLILVIGLISFSDGLRKFLDPRTA